MTFLGLDIGDRRIGVALATDPTTSAFALTTLPNNRAFLNELVKLRHQYKFDVIVIGLPYTFAGQLGAQAHKVQQLAEKIKKKLLVEIIFQDERLTTKMASENLRTNPQKTVDIDALSAQVILQSWLSGQGR